MVDQATRDRVLTGDLAHLPSRAAAEQIGVGDSTVRKWRNPESARLWARRDNARRASAKRAWEARARGTCVRCGGPRGIGTICPSRDKLTRLCIECFRAEEAERKRQLVASIEALWAEGLTVREIAERLHYTEGSMSVEINRARKQGANLPYRYPQRNGRRIAG